MPSHDQHDRTWRFMQTAFPWAAPPPIDALRETAEQISVTISLGGTIARCRQAQLTTLAIMNVVGRLPVGMAFRACDVGDLLLPPPYGGETLHLALDDLAARLDRGVDLGATAQEEPATVRIATPRGDYQFHVATDGWTAYMGATPSEWPETYNPMSAYLVACMIGGEVLRSWAKLAADLRAGEPGASFPGRTRTAADRWVNLWAPGTIRSGPLAAASELPPIDWAGAGAVNQATLAALVATPGWAPRGRVIDPKLLDLPDLNRSPLSFVGDIGLPKAKIVSAMASAGYLEDVRGIYPNDISERPAGWIVAGTDDPVVRDDIQRLWPERLVVTATEDVFGYVAWHARTRQDLACAGCGPTLGLDGAEPMPTSAPSSTAAGVVAAATLLRLAADERVAGRTDILTLRLDSAHALDGSNPSPVPGCATCRTRPDRS